MVAFKSQFNFLASYSYGVSWVCGRALVVEAQACKLCGELPIDPNRVHLRLNAVLRLHKHIFPRRFREDL